MAYNYSINVPAHPNIYTGDNLRKYRIEYSVPNDGTDKDTGIIVLVPGFGANIDSNVYKKMRETFADTYNCVTIQCEYFGSKFMQVDYPIFFDMDNLKSAIPEEVYKKIQEDNTKFYELLSKLPVKLEAQASLDENVKEFADLGFMQAIDILTAIEMIKIVLRENSLDFNTKRVIGYGHSHGAYLLLLCNRLAPHLFSYIIDNSAWISPVYIQKPRLNFLTYDQLQIKVRYNYAVREFLEDKDALSLESLYSKFNNGAYIYSLIGTTDHLVSVNDKLDFSMFVNNCFLNVINEEKIDGEIFKTTEHGLDADFLMLFEQSINEFPEYENVLELEKNYSVKSSNTEIIVDYTADLPLFQIR